MRFLGVSPRQWHRRNYGLGQQSEIAAFFLPVSGVNMRVSFSKRCSVPVYFVLLRTKMAVGLIGSVWFGTLSAAEDAEQKLARLGFAFDSHAHEVAVAAAEGEPEKGKGGPSDVILLPKYFVTEKRLPFTEHEILTPRGRLELAKKTYLSPVYRKTFGPLSAVLSLINNPLGGWHPNGPEAMVLYEEAEQMRRNKDMKDLMQLDALHEKSVETSPSSEESANH